MGSVESSAQGINLAAPWLLPLTAGLVGSVMTSFAGVVADRMPRIRGWSQPAEKGISLSHPPSHCDSCGHKLSPIDLIPVIGWLIRGGHCAHCGTNIPVTYPIMEAAGFIFSLLVVLILGATWAALATCICLWILIIVSWLDWEAHEIPDIFTVPLGSLGLLASPFEADPWTRIMGSVIAALFLWLAFSLTGKAKKIDTMSYGDIALAAALGGWLGLCGTIPFLIAAPVVYLLYAIPMRMKGVEWSPMGPALSIAFLGIAILGIRL